MYATLYGDADDVRLLLERGADPNIQNDDGGTALMYAIDDAAKVRLLCSTTVRQMWMRFPATVELLSRLRWPTPGRPHVVKMLLDKSKAVPSLNQAGSSGRPGRAPIQCCSAAPIQRLLLSRSVMS